MCVYSGRSVTLERDLDFLERDKDAELSCNYLLAQNGFFLFTFNLIFRCIFEN